jgi:hypothetical protein
MSNLQNTTSYSLDPNFWKEDERAQVVQVPARNTLVLPKDKSALKQQALSSLQGAMASLPAPQVIQIGTPQRQDHTGHARSDDSAISIATAALAYSAGYGLVFGGILFPMVLIAVFAWGYDGAQTAIGALILWGCVTMFALNRNREQGLRHSPTGVALAQTEADENVRHHQIESNERLEMANNEIRREISRGYLQLLEKINADDNQIIEV